MKALPASHTKHLDRLSHPLPHKHDIFLDLRQASSLLSGESTGTTGTTLWLSAQVVSLHLASLGVPARDPLGRRPVAVELGSGIGYLALVLASLGYDVIATDIGPALPLLAENIDKNLYTLQQKVGYDNVGSIQVLELDWEEVSTSGRLPAALEAIPELSLIITTDTVYAPQLVEPLFHTISFLSSTRDDTSNQLAGLSPKRRAPTVVVGLERRDCALVDTALQRAAGFGLDLKRVARPKLSKEVSRWDWTMEDWEGIEVWKGRVRSRDDGLATR